jgi:hypothetical protein
MFAYPLTLKEEEAHNCAAGPGVSPVLPILALPHRTPLHMDRHNLVIHIVHTAAHGKGTRSRVKLGKRGSKHQGGTTVSQGCRIS